MLTNIKSESNAPFLKSPPLAHKIIFFEKKSTSSSKIRVGKMPAFMSKVHAGGIYRRLLVFTGVYWNLPAFTDIAGFCYYSLY